MSVLEELYCGNIHPIDKYMRKGGEYSKLTARIVRRIDKLMLLMNEEETAIWQEIYEMVAERESLSEKESFIDGFCLGVQIMQEAMTSDRIEREVL